MAVAWCQEQVQEHFQSRSKYYWGVRILGHPDVVITYTHPHQLVYAVQWSTTVNHSCLPLCLGVGPVQGGSKIPSRAGVRDPRTLYISLLNDLYIGY